MGRSASGITCLADLQDVRFTGQLPEGPTSEDILLLMYTSGTTARPKGCMIPHRAVTANALAIGERYAITAKDVWWCPLPMFHVGGLLFLSVMLARGGLYLGMAHFTPENTFELVEEWRPSIFYPLFPTITFAMTSHPDFAKFDFTSIKKIFSVAPADVQRKIQRSFPGATLFSAYGMTETCGTVTFNTLDHDETQRMETCGTPLPGWQMKIVDPQSRLVVGAGERGEIAAKGIGIFKGYFGDDELTRSAFSNDDFFFTGDIGSIDEQGLLTFHGRLKDQLKVGGENVSALEVESFLATHASVKIAQVVGIPDEKYGEVPIAFVESFNGCSITEAEILAFCTGRIARFKIPRHVRQVSEWPMSATKILKYKLREEFLRAAAGEAPDQKAG
jgi:acyl-CoA synthetase (AMP-forming)/AMP-acid ligase II